MRRRRLSGANRSLKLEKEEVTGDSLKKQIENRLLESDFDGDFLGECLHRLNIVDIPLKKEDMIALLAQFGFKNSTTRGSHFYYVKENEGKKTFCLIHSHTNELTRAEKRLCLQRILSSL